MNYVRDLGIYLDIYASYDEFSIRVELPGCLRRYGNMTVISVVIVIGIFREVYECRVVHHDETQIQITRNRSKSTRSLKRCMNLGIAF